jgi:hypothetical protein
MTCNITVILSRLLVRHHQTKTSGLTQAQVGSVRASGCNGQAAGLIIVSPHAGIVMMQSLQVDSKHSTSFNSCLFRSFSSI